MRALGFIRYILLILKHFFKQCWIQSKYVNVVLSTKSTLIVENDDMLIVGKGVYIADFTVIHVVNDKGKNNSSLTIGDNCYIGEFNNIRAAGGNIIIGDNCLISQHITLVAANHSIGLGEVIREQPWCEKKVSITIGDDVWIGSHVVVLPGVKIGSGAVIGAGSIVTHDVEPNAIVVGNPARKVKERV